MQAKFIQPGREIDYTPAENVVAGQVVAQGQLVGVAKEAIAAGAKGALSVAGIFDVQQEADVIAAGAAVYWDADGTPVGVGATTTGAATDTAAGNTFMGFAEALTEATDLTVRVALRSAERVAGAFTTATAITGTASTLPIKGLEAAQGGTATLAGGVSTTAANAGGATSLTGGRAGSEGVGGAATVAGGIGGSTSGAGGAASVTGGAGTSGDANGGAVAINGGAKHGSGADGAITIGTAAAASVTVGKTGVLTAFAGPAQMRFTEARTATTGGGTTGLITAGTNFVVVTSDHADKQISLPAASVGDEIEIYVASTHGCELISAVEAHEINDVVVGETNELALVLDSLYRCKYVATNKWIVTGTSKLGANEDTLTPDVL